MRLLWRMEVGCVDPGRLVSVDEMGTHTSLAPLYAYAPVGERAFFKIPRNRGKNTMGLTRFYGPIRVKRSASVKGLEEDGQDRQAVSA